MKNKMRNMYFFLNSFLYFLNARFINFTHFFTEKMKIILENQRNHVKVKFFKFVNLKNILK